MDGVDRGDRGDDVRVNARGCIRANAVAYFLRAADEGDLVDQFLGERGRGPGTVPVRPAFREFPGGVFVAGPCEKP